MDERTGDDRSERIQEATGGTNSLGAQPEETDAEAQAEGDADNAD